jgi:flagellar biosynthesis protein FlhG
MASAERGDRILGALAEKEMSFNRMKFGMMKDMLPIIFPEMSTITRGFVTRLTPEELKRAYIRQAVRCHPRTTEHSNKQEKQTRQLHYQRLSTAYRTLLPWVENIHQKVQQIESRHKLKGANKTILAVGGAKGGVGKSMLAANLAVGLALLGQRVVLADLDFGGADAHLHLGVSALDTNWNDFLEKKAQTIDEILVPTRFEGLDLIAGDSSKLGSANLNYFQKLKIIRHLKGLNRDYVILDLGGDTSFNVLDFFLMADQRFVVTAAEPASFLDTYNFVKVSFYRFLDRLFSEYELLKDLRERVRSLSMKKPQGPTFQSILKEVRSRHPSAYFKLKLGLEQYRLSIVLNMAENSSDMAIAESMKRLLEKLFSIHVRILGTIPFDGSVRRAARNFSPFIVEDPSSKASQGLYQMLAGILQLRETKSIRADLSKKIRPIRGKQKGWVSSREMNLDDVKEEQIRFASERLPNLHRGFRKILKVAAN